VKTPLRTKLAIIGGFTRPHENIAHGTHHAAYRICEAIAKQGRYDEIHVFNDAVGPSARGVLSLPASPPTRVFDKLQLPASTARYQAIYVANGEQIGPAPSILRQHDDWSPLIQSIGTAHAAAQWQSFLVGALSDSFRATDGLIFKSRSAQGLFAEVFAEWRERWGPSLSFPEASVVIGNGVDVSANRRSGELRANTRNRLRLASDDIVFLAFSRLSPATKGDQMALVVRWKQVIERVPRALLLLSGAQVERGFVMELRQLARAAGVGDRVMVLENPFELLPNARESLMSAADVFVHLTTGVEETSSLVIHEAMAHSLPVIASAWAGLPEAISHGHDGFLIPTRVMPTSPETRNATFSGADLAAGLAASRCVTCDYDRFVAAAVTLESADVRQTMGARARATAEAHNLSTVADAHLAFFAVTSALAASAWPVHRSFRPLVDLDRVLVAQSGGSISTEAWVTLQNRDLTNLLRAGMSVEAPAVLEAVTSAFDETPRIPLVALAARMARAGGLDSIDAEQTLRWASRSIVRLVNFGVLALSPPPRDGSSRSLRPKLPAQGS
jgi:glycosyltransferase involved in cell wall biosynthesis